MRKTSMGCVLVCGALVALLSIPTVRLVAYADANHLEANDPKAVDTRVASRNVLSGLSTPELSAETMPNESQAKLEDRVSAVQTYTVIEVAPTAASSMIDSSTEIIVPMRDAVKEPSKAPQPDQVAVKKEEVKPPPAPKIRVSSKPYVTTNLSAAQFDVILKGTGLAGQGKSYYNLEQKYGINGVFAISVAFLESGYGKYQANTNNYYGMRGSKGWMAFDSTEDNIDYFGELMLRDRYVSKQTVSGIGTVYCPSTAESWASKVLNIMRDSFEKLS